MTHSILKQLAKAGFYYTPTKKGCDCVRCFCCYKELENWDDGDDPWVEHLKHQSSCLFAQLKTEESKLTLNQLAQLLAAREANRCVSIFIHNYVQPRFNRNFLSLQHKFLTQLKAHKEVLEILEEL